MKKLVSLALIAILVFAFATNVSAKTTVPDAINFVEGIATIDGVISPSEWDDCTPIYLKLADVLEDSESGAGVAGGNDLVPEGARSNDDVTTMVKFKVKDGFLYMLETRIDKTLVFTHDELSTPYSSDGSIVFFCRPGEANVVDIFAVARSKSVDAPLFGVRYDNLDPAEALTAVESKAVITKDGFILEAKFKLSDLNMTEADLKAGKYLVTYCAVNVYNTAFDGDVTGLWTPNAYQMQYKGVVAWDDSPVVKVVEGAAFPPAATTDDKTPPATDSGTKTNDTPKTADAGTTVAMLLVAVSAAGFVVLKKRA